MSINNKNKEDGQKMVMDYINNPTNENKEKVVLAFLPLVNHVINKIPIDSYQNILTKEDLFQNGVMGLLSSLDKYDPELNTNTILLWLIPLILFVFGGILIIKKLSINSLKKK